MMTGLIDVFFSSSVRPGIESPVGQLIFILFYGTPNLLSTNAQKRNPYPIPRG